MRLLLLTAAAAATVSLSQFSSAPRPQPANCDADNAGLKLPDGFCATLFAESLAAPRQMEVAPNGDVIVGLRGIRASQGRPAMAPGVTLLRDADGDGRAERRATFGDSSTTTVRLFGDALYVETGRSILRYALPAGAMSPRGAPDTIVSGLPGDKSHTAKTFAVHDGRLYVNHGSGTNSCQPQDRAPRVKGEDPCAELAYRAGIWRYDMNKTGQTLANGERFATGIRNAVAIAFQPGTNDLFVVQHGRDMLAESWGFTPQKNAETPAEEMFRVTRGADFGWPYCYFDPELKQKVLAPEYGGDGKTVGRCADKQSNVGYFPGHWAPNGLLFYTGSALPAKYRNGAFITFHGSWNRAPLPQQGFKVVFQPMSRGRASGSYEVFIEGFIDAEGKPTALGGRPMALAQGRNGELYLSDDSRGRIWKITYTGTK